MPAKTKARETALAIVSLDLDNQWSYMKTHGDAGWESFPSYLDLVVPSYSAFLDVFTNLSCQLTWRSVPRVGMPLVMELRPRREPVLVASNPIGARIGLNGRDTGKVTPAEIELDPDQAVTLRAGYSANADVVIREKTEIVLIPERLVLFSDDGSVDQK